MSVRYFLDTFWDEKWWLPANTTWADVTPGPDKAVVYNDYRHLLYTLPMALMIIVLRRTVEKYCFAPLGKSLGIKHTRPKKAPNVPKLEAAYKASPNVKHQQICALAKQLDMSERQVERWWRLRRSQDKPTTLVKFCENAWKGSFLLFSFCFGLYVLWDKEWLWDLDQCYIGYPHQGITNDLWWYFMITIAFNTALALTLFTDVKRKDFWQMFLHHVITITLLSFGLVCNMHRMALLIVLTHDSSEFILEAAKATKYAGYQKTCDFLFAVFTAAWIATRVWVYMFYILWSTLFRFPAVIPVFPSLYLFNTLLCMLMGQNIMWTYLILRVLYRSVISGKMERDIRSSSSEMSDSPDCNRPSDHDTPNGITNNDKNK